MKHIETMRAVGSRAVGKAISMNLKITPKAWISSIPQGIAYHQCEALDIIKPQVDTR